MRELIAGVVGSVIDSLTPLAYRLAAYFVLSILDDPAMLALAFC